MQIPRQNTMKLTHFGRKSGKEFQVTIWFCEIDGELWTGSLDGDRNWVRNLCAAGRGRIDFGAGPIDVRVEPVEAEAERARYSAAVTAKYPILGRLLALFVRGGRRVAFRLLPT